MKTYPIKRQQSQVPLGRDRFSVNNVVNTWSRGTCFTKPLTTVLGLASPTSTFSTYSESASGCFSAVMMQPTRRSRRETSTGFESLLPAAGCCFFSFFSPVEGSLVQETKISIKSCMQLFAREKWATITESSINPVQNANDKELAPLLLVSRKEPSYTFLFNLLLHMIFTVGQKCFLACKMKSSWP